MKKIIVGILVTLSVCSSAFAGNCDHSWQTASNGTACGGRSADTRPGGK